MKKKKIMFWGIGSIFIALCAVLFYSKKVQAPQVFNEMYSLERSEDIENTIERYEYVSADDIENQASVEESDEVKESNVAGEFESEEAISHDYASVYERADYASIYKKAINYAIPVLCEEGYEILCENICVNPKSVYEDSWLVEQLEDILDSCRDCEWAATDYFLFDLNDDGIDEYIVSIYSSGWDRIFRASC